MGLVKDILEVIGLLLILPFAWVYWKRQRQKRKGK